MNKKILDILSRATPANDDNSVSAAPKSRSPQAIKLSFFNKNNTTRNGNINVVSFNGLILVAIVLIITFLIFFQQTL